MLATIPRSRWATGIASSVCFALLIFSLLLAWFGYGLVYLIIGSFGLIIVFGFALAIWVGLFCAGRGYIPAMPLWVVVLTAVIGWPLCAYGPIAARVFWMKRDALSEVPIMSQAQGMSVSVKWLGSDSGPPRACFDYRAGNTQQAVFQFYREQMQARGWAADEKSFYAQWVQTNALPIALFQKNNSFIRIEYTQKGQTANQGSGPLNEVEVCYSPAGSF